MSWATEIYTEKVIESKLFYCQYFGFKVEFETEGYVELENIENPSFKLLFCIPNSPFVNQLFKSEYNGHGLIFQLEVEDVVLEYERMTKFDIEIALDLIEEEFNGKHFTVIDPNGILIDVTESIAH